MILTCPDCATRYLTKPEAIGPNGRTVRCASCSATWFVPAEPDVLDLAAAGVSASESPPVSNKDVTPKDVMAKEGGAGLVPVAAGTAAAGAIRDKAERKKVRRRLFGVGAIWLVVLALLAAAALAAYVLRGPVVQRFPAAATLYQSLGIQVSENGLVFERVITRSAYIEGTPTVIIEGAVRNPDNVTHLAAPVKMSLHNASGEPLVSWLVELGAPSVAAGGQIEFVTQYPNPPIDATVLRYVFDGASDLPTADVITRDALDEAIAEGTLGEDALLLAPIPANPSE